MSAILDSIADAEALAHIGDDVTATTIILARATAARAEHAEMVEALKDARDAIGFWNDYAGAYFQEKHNLKADIEAIDTLLSRVSGEA